MRWSWRIATVAGIGIHIHATFLILLAWIWLDGYRRAGAAGAAAGVAFVLAVFASVVLHEYGHALTARRYGIPTRDITLLPIGGVARLERMPRDPRQELMIAIAGPAVNVVIAAVLWVGLRAFTGEGLAAALAEPGPGTGREFIGRLLAANVTLVVFNLIPAFPMDGGRVLRALLAMRQRDYVRATETAARIGQVFALLFGIYGLVRWSSSPLLVLLALFVWLAAAGEAAAVRTSASLEGVPTKRVMITDLRTLAPTDPLSRAVQLVLGGFQQDFPVVEGGTVVGMLTRADLFRALTARGESSPVGEAMRREFQVASPDEPIEQSLARLKSGESGAIPVVRGRELLGVLTAENVGEFLMVESALRKESA
jgi:Zn-dependent protease/CBS domain-containing protein